MTVDAVNTDIFDDDRITGIICVWFVGEKLRGCGSTTEPLNVRRIPGTLMNLLWRPRANIRRFLMRWPMQ